MAKRKRTKGQNITQKTKKNTSPTQSFSCPKKLTKITKTRK